MGNRLESFTTRVWDVGVSRLIGLAMRSMHEKPRGSGDVDFFGPHNTHGGIGTLGTVSNPQLAWPVFHLLTAYGRFFIAIKRATFEWLF